MTFGVLFLSYYDLFITPFYLVMIFMVIFLISKYFIAPELRYHFMMGISLKIFAAILFGVIYNYLYYGGDTSGYWYCGSIIGDSFYDSPLIWFKLLMNEAPDELTYSYISRIGPWYNDPATFAPIRIVGFLSPFCFNTYSIMAAFFAVINFSGVWYGFKALYNSYPYLKKEIAIAFFYIPSVVFWGSGIMKDGLTLSALGFFFYSIHDIIVYRKISFRIFIILALSSYVLIVVKIYIFLCIIPALIIWIFIEYTNAINNPFTRNFIKPIMLFVAVALSLFAINFFSEFNDNYSIQNIEKTSKITRDYLLAVSKDESGSSYSLGEFSGGISDYIIKFPLAVNVTLFRPYLWESRNFFMFVNAMENTVMLYLLLNVLVTVGFIRFTKIVSQNGIILFFLLFCITFSFAIGISTFNFGTLARYRIPILPFYLMLLLFVRYITKRKTT